MLRNVYTGLCETGCIVPILYTANLLAQINQEIGELKMAFAFPLPSISYSYDSLLLACT